MADDINARADAHRVAVARYEQYAADALTARYQSVLDALKPQLAQLTAQIEEARANGETVSRSWLFRQERYKSLLAQVESEINRFGGTAGRTITSAQAGAVDMAQNHTEALTASVSTSFTRLPKATFENLVGNLGDGSPLSALLDKLSSDGKKAVGDALAKGVALGWNPRKTAKEVMVAAELPRDRALTICRTETLRAYRQAAIQSYQENDDIVTGWKWLAALGPRSCAMCIAMHGTVHPITEVFGSHVCCRCCPSPVVIGSENDAFETGAEWFAKQNETAQDTILGSRAAGEEYRSGEVRLSDFVGEREDDKWGLTRYALSLRGALDVRPRAFAPNEDNVQSEGGVPAAKKTGTKGQTGKSVKDWRTRLDELLTKRENFLVWGDLLPEESRTELFASERTKQMLEHLLEIGNVVRDEAERRLKVLMDSESLTTKQVKEDSMFVNVTYATKVAGQERKAKARATAIARSAFRLDLDEVEKDSKKQTNLDKLLIGDPDYQATRLELSRLDGERDAALIRQRRLVLLRRKAYGEVLREARGFGLQEGEHAFTWTGDTNAEAGRAADEAASYYPSDWLKKSRETGRVKVDFAERANYVEAYRGAPVEFWISRDREAEIKGDSNTLSDAIHEFGHRFEDVYPEVKVFEALYYRKRTAISDTEQEALAPLPRPEAYYNRKKNNEPTIPKTRSKTFTYSYIGKDMGNDYDSNYELLTMGMEGIFTDKYRIYRMDDDLCGFVLGLLTGI